MSLINICDVSFTYAGGKSKALENVNIDIEAGEFAVLCGATGSGKSTLLRLLKRELMPAGSIKGQIRLKGKPLAELDERVSACSIGYVAQQPEQQLVTDKVWHELAFGLENMGLPQEMIRRRVAEMASFFDIEGWFEMDVDALSGGQKQLLNLAAVLVMQPEVLILDEPTAQLDPIAATNFINTINRLNKEFGLTIVIVEHRLEELIPICDKLIFLEHGRVLHLGEKREAITWLRSECQTAGEGAVEECSKDKHETAAARDRDGVSRRLLVSMPAAVQLYCSLVTAVKECPLSISEGRRFIRDNFQNKIKSLERAAFTGKSRIEAERAAFAGKSGIEAERTVFTGKGEMAQPILECRGISFSYGRGERDILKDLSLQVYESECLCILGGNGSGKTTLLKCMAALLQPYRGQIRVFGKRLKEYRGQELYRNGLNMLPQDVQTVFLKDTVREELGGLKAEDEIIRVFGNTKMSSVPESSCNEFDSLFDISGLLDMHPYDLSGGERQLVAFARVLMENPRLLLLDEPTKGLDTAVKYKIAEVIKSLKTVGISLVIVTHDIEFAALCADRCALMFNGEITAINNPETFFDENTFFTTAANRMTRGYYQGIITTEDAIEICRLNQTAIGADLA